MNRFLQATRSLAKRNSRFRGELQREAHKLAAKNTQIWNVGAQLNNKLLDERTIKGLIQLRDTIGTRLELSPHQEKDLRQWVNATVAPLQKVLDSSRSKLGRWSGFP